MKTELSVNGKSDGPAESGKRSAYNCLNALTPAEWKDVLWRAIEAVGIQHVVRLGDPSVWRQAVSELAPSRGVLERLRCLKRPEHFEPFALWTHHGESLVLIGEASAFHVDDSGSVVAYFVDDEKGVQFVPVAAIGSVRTATVTEDLLKSQLCNLLEACPFIPFRIRLLNGHTFSVKQPYWVVPAAEAICVFSKSDQTLTVHAGSYRWSWVESIEPIAKPDCPQGTPEASADHQEPSGKVTA